MTRMLIAMALLCVCVPGRAAVEPGQVWLLGSSTTLDRDGAQIALRPGDRFEVLETGERSVFGRCSRGEASVEGRIALAALATALTEEQFEALRSAMTTYVYSDDDAARRAAAAMIRGFDQAGFALQEYAASRVGLLVEEAPNEAQTLTVTLPGGVRGQYYLVLPPGYDRSKRYPLIMTFHGRGGNGSYCQHWRAGSESRRPCILVGPTNPEPNQKSWWADESGELILAALRATMRDYAVDPWRVYAEGFSMGGGAATFWTQTWPDRFAAIGAQAFGTSRSARHRTGSAENMRLVPAFLVVGDKDISRSITFFKQLDADLTRFGTPHVFRLLKNTGHMFVGPDDELFAFLLKWRRNLYPRAIAYNYYRPPAGELEPEWVYWLRIREGTHTGRVDARVQGNTITVRTKGMRHITVYLSDWLVNLDRPVSVMVNGVSAHTGPVKRDVFTMLDVIRETGDPARLFSAKVEVRVR